VLTSLVFATTALAQMPTSPWKKGAPFPEPDEELYGVTANGKLYVMGGWGDGKARGANYEYDPATDRWTKKAPMPRPAHHAALAAATARFTRLAASSPRRPPLSRSVPHGNRSPTRGSSIRPPIHGSRSAPLPGKRGSAIAAEVNGKIYVIGGATTMEGSEGPILHRIRTCQGSWHERRVRPGHEQVGKP
jgi:N-acetylneuraminic acid mutarotase